MVTNNSINTGLPGTAITKNASDNTKTVVASVSGATTIGNLATFADILGTIADGGAIAAIGGRLINIQWLTGASGTYTKTVGANSGILIGQGSGGGGGGTGTGSPGVGGSASTSVFGSLLTMNGGGGGGASNGQGGAFGAAASGGTVNLAGSYGCSTATPVSTVGGQGAPGMFGMGAGRGAQVSGNGNPGQSNTGAGGGGAGGGATFAGGAGGGSGGFSILYIATLPGTASYTNAAGGGGGTAGTGGNTGAAGASGCFIMLEFT